MESSSEKNVDCDGMANNENASSVEEEEEHSPQVSDADIVPDNEDRHL